MTSPVKDESERYKDHFAGFESDEEDNPDPTKTFSAVTDDYRSLPTYPERRHYHKHHIHMKPATQVVVFDGCPQDPHHPASMPIYQTATFVQPSATEFGSYDYTRSGNPTRTALETLIAGLEKAYASFAFTSGMSALSAVTRLVEPGGEILACSDLYGGMHRLLSQVTHRLGVTVKFVDTTNLDAVEQAIGPKTYLIHIESPSNPLMRITDIRKISQLAQKKKILLSVDSTMMSPILMNPLVLGADIVVHSGTKFLSGHSDTTMGAVCAKSEELAKKLAFYQNAEGTGLAPFECWLILRGMKTISLRVERSQQNAQKVAEFLDQHPLVTIVHYAGLKPKETLPNYQQLLKEYELHHSQSRGGGCVLSFETGDEKLSERIVNAFRLFKITVSFGSCNSLVEMPCVLSHASIPKEKRAIPGDLIRMSIGIEDSADILEDVHQALQLAGSNK